MVPFEAKATFYLLFGVNDFKRGQVTNKFKLYPNKYGRFLHEICDLGCWDMLTSILGDGYYGDIDFIFLNSIIDMTLPLSSR